MDLRSDPDNCGRCDNECQENHGQVCSDGKCAAKCAPTLANCGQVCDGGLCVTPGACKQEGEACTANECCGNLGLVCLAGVMRNPWLIG